MWLCVYSVFPPSPYKTLKTSAAILAQGAVSLGRRLSAWAASPSCPASDVHSEANFGVNTYFFVYPVFELYTGQVYTVYNNAYTVFIDPGFELFAADWKAASLNLGCPASSGAIAGADQFTAMEDPPRHRR